MYLLAPLHLMGDRVSGVLNLMEDNLPSVTTYIFQSLPWEQWWLAEHPAPVGLSGFKGTAANGIYTQTGPPLDGFVYSYDINSTEHWKDISLMIDSSNWWNGLGPTTDDAASASASKHMVAKESPPSQSYWYPPSTAKNPSSNQSHDSDSISARKSAGRSRFVNGNLNPQPKKNSRQSTSCCKGSASSNGGHSAQQGNNSITKIQERNPIAAKKLRVKQREEQLRLESSNQDLERIHRDLSTCVADLRFEVYELKMQLLQHSGCNCTLMQNYLAHESLRYVQALVEESQ